MYFLGRHVNEQAAKSDAAELTPRASATSRSIGRLSRISSNTKYAIALNQIDRIAILSTYEREGDGVTMYELEVIVRCAQTGIPTSRRSSVHSEPDEELHERNPHYRLVYRFSDFCRLRCALQDASESGINPHEEWCVYCHRLNWIAHAAPFPLRSPFDKWLDSVSWLKRWRVRRRRVKLTQFLDLILHGVKSVQYRFSGEPCAGFHNTSSILKEFLSEPHVRLSGAGW